MSSLKSNTILLLFFTTITVSSCKSRKLAQPVTMTLETVQKYWDSQFDSDYVEARGKAALTTNGKTTNVSMHLKIKKDSIIWGKFSLFGIGATVLITQDSFFMVNSLSQEYMAYDNSYLDQYLGYRANIGQVQNLLLGNAIFPKGDYIFESVKMELSGNEGLATNTLRLNDEIRTYSSEIRTEDYTQSAHIQYDMYENVNELLMPKIVSIDVKKGNQNLDVVLNYQNVNTNLISTFPFKIPNGFIRR